MTTESRKRGHLKSKSYRIHRNYEMLLYTCIQFYGDLKTDLFLTLAKSGKITDSDRFLTLPKYSKNDFIEHILEQLKNQNKTIDDLRNLFSDPKLNQLFAHYIEVFSNENPNILLQTRIEPTYQEFIEDFMEQRIGEVIELSVALYISKVDQFEFDMIEYLYQIAIDKALKEKFSQQLPFNTHTIYLSLEGQYYILHQDHTKEKVEKIRKHSPKHPSVLLDQQEFLKVKDRLIDPNNTHRISKETAAFYHQIGFLSDKEMQSY